METNQKGSLSLQFGEWGPTLVGFRALGTAWGHNKRVRLTGVGRMQSRETRLV